MNRANAMNNFSPKLSLREDEIKSPNIICSVVYFAQWMHAFTGQNTQHCSQSYNKYRRLMLLNYPESHKQRAIKFAKQITPLLNYSLSFELQYLYPCTPRSVLTSTFNKLEDFYQIPTSYLFEAHN